MTVHRSNPTPASKQDAEDPPPKRWRQYINAGANRLARIVALHAATELIERIMALFT